MITVAEINDIERLASLRLTWQSLWNRMRNPSFFGSLDWLEHYLRRFGSQQKLRALVVSVAGNPIGIVPLVVKRVSTRLGVVRALTYPLDGWGTFYGPVGPHSAATLMGAMRYLSNTRRDWDLIDLRYVDFERSDRGRTRKAMRAAGLQSYQRVWRPAVVVDMHGGWQEYWDTRSPDLQMEYEAREQQFSQLGRVSFDRYRPGGTICGETERRRDLFAAFEKLATANGNADRPTAGDGLDFLRDLHASAVDAGTVDLNLLSLNGKPIACAYNYHRGGLVEPVQIAVDPDTMPGAECVLMGRMLHDSSERGDRTFLFNRQDTAVASPWQTSTLASYRYTHFAPMGPRATILRLNHCMKHWFVEDDPLQPIPVNEADAPPNHEPTQLTVVG